LNIYTPNCPLSLSKGEGTFLFNAKKRELLASQVLREASRIATKKEGRILLLRQRGNSFIFIIKIILNFKN
jgi:hypothetical protein